MWYDSREDEREQEVMEKAGWIRLALSAGDYWFEIQGVLVGVETKSSKDFMGSWVKRQKKMRRLDEQLFRLKERVQMPILLYGASLQPNKQGWTEDSFMEHHILFTSITNTLLDFQRQGVYTIPYNDTKPGLRAHAIITLKKGMERDWDKFEVPT